MRGELKRKTTRTVHGQKIIRLRIDIPIAEVENAGSETQDIPRWLDKRVGYGINFNLTGITDEQQIEIDDALASGRGQPSGPDTYTPDLEES